MSFKRFRKFLRNEAGNYAIMFGLTVFPILGGVALAVDYTNIQRYRGAVQDSLDAAALATAKEYSSGVTGTALEDYAKDFFDSNLPNFIPAGNVDLGVSLVDSQIVDTNGDPAIIKTVKLDASLEYDSFVAQVLGYDKFDLGISSQVALGNITVEVAMVMDNSGSMSQNGKITSERDTAKQLVDTIFAAGANSNKPNPVSFSLIPFSAMVNVDPGNAGEEWMDTNGWSPIHNENLNWKTYITSNPTQFNGAGFQEQVSNVWKWRSRFSLYSLMGINWTGCVEERPWPYNTTDDSVTTGIGSVDAAKVTQDSSSSDLAKLYVPIFAPDEPDSTYVYKSGSGTYTSKDWYNYNNNYAYDWRRPRPTNPSKLQQLYYNTDYTAYNNGSNFNYSSGVIQSHQNARQDWIWRYQADTFGYSESGYSSGPNLGCTTTPVTPLTTSKTTIKSSIDAMGANGNTNIQAGVAWGWRTLSPKIPFTGGRDPSDTTNRKYMIVLTDGNNTYNPSSTPNETTYGAWGYGKQGRIENGLSSSDLAGT
ncbi:MAG: pilus assembly protein TadG-related protein, partial [Salaquimonas sp.]|nr:pilus assembly protein TadG-related protein [Salaquimonas sp.]